MCKGIDWLSMGHSAALTANAACSGEGRAWAGERVIAHHAVDRGGEAVPQRALFSEAALAVGGEAVETGATPGFADAPIGGEVAAFGEAVERGVERAFFDGQDVVAAAFDLACDGVAVGLGAAEDREEHDVEGALEEGGLRAGLGGCWHGVLRDRVDQGEYTLTAYGLQGDGCGKVEVIEDWIAERLEVCADPGGSGGVA